MLALAKSQPAMKRKATGESVDQTPDHEPDSEPTPRPGAQLRLRWVIQRWTGAEFGWVTGHTEFFRHFHQARLILEALERCFEDVPFRISLHWVECAEEDLSD